MKFEQKLMNLRKQKSMSQEELAEKINVTRQTISKWELGQSKPDMDKLIELSKLFDVSVEELTNDTIDIGKEKVNTVSQRKEKKERKYILYILIVILIASVATLAIRVGTAYEEAKAKQEGLVNNIFGTFTDMVQGQMQGNDTNINGNSIFETATDMIEGQMQNNSTDANLNDVLGEIDNVQQEQEEEKVSTSVFNIGFTYAEGTKATIFVENILDKVVTSNKQNKDMLITVVYKNKKTTNVDEIKKIKKSLKEWSEYEVSVDYDDDGYVNKITIEE